MTFLCKKQAVIYMAVDTIRVMCYESYINLPLSYIKLSFTLIYIGDCGFWRGPSNHSEITGTPRSPPSMDFFLISCRTCMAIVLN